MLKSFKSFKSFKGDSNVSFQILCKSTAILLYRCEENIKKLLNRFLCAVYYVTASKLYTLAIPLLYPCLSPIHPTLYTLHHAASPR